MGGRHLPGDRAASVPAQSRTDAGPGMVPGLGSAGWALRPGRPRPKAAAPLCVHRITTLWGLPLQVRRAVSVVLPGPIVHFINQRRWVVL